MLLVFMSVLLVTLLLALFVAVVMVISMIPAVSIQTPSLLYCVTRCLHAVNAIMLAEKCHHLPVPL